MDIGIIVKYVGGVVAGFLALVMILRLGKKAWEFIKGTGAVSVWAIIGDILILLLMFGFVYIAINYKDLEGLSQSWGQKAINAANDIVQNVSK